MARSIRGPRGGRHRWGWEIWHILCIKDHFFTISRGVSNRSRGTEPPPPHFNYWLQQYSQDACSMQVFRRGPIQTSILDALAVVSRSCSWSLICKPIACMVWYTRETVATMVELTKSALMRLLSSNVSLCYMYSASLTVARSRLSILWLRRLNYAPTFSAEKTRGETENLWIIL